MAAKPPAAPPALPRPLYPARVVSGGQTGVDRGALQAAMAADLDHGGWCPLGRRAEDGRIPAQYQLIELTSPDYSLRTEQNVLDSDGTLVLHRGDVAGGTRLTVRMAHKHQRPCLQVDLNEPVAPQAVRQWLERHRIATLNCAGPRESTYPGIEQQTREYLSAILARDR